MSATELTRCPYCHGGGPFTPLGSNDISFPYVRYYGSWRCAQCNVRFEPAPKEPNTTDCQHHPDTWCEAQRKKE